MSCCMRDAAALEVRGTPTVIIVNDVFKPIAHATRALLALPEDYVESHVVWLPHPTSNLSKAAAERLIDERIDEIRAKLTGRSDVSSNGQRSSAPEPQSSASAASATSPAQNGAALEAARAAIAGLAESLRADGAFLELDEINDGILRGTLRLGELTCEDGSCIMPTEQLERMIEALLDPKLGLAVRSVSLEEIRL